MAHIDFHMGEEHHHASALTASPPWFYRCMGINRVGFRLRLSICTYLLSLSTAHCIAWISADPLAHLMDFGFGDCSHSLLIRVCWVFPYPAEMTGEETVDAVVVRANSFANGRCRIGCNTDLCGPASDTSGLANCLSVKLKVRLVRKLSLLL